MQVGLLGWLTRSTLSQVNAARLNISDEVDAMRQCVSDFKAAHPDVGILVGVSHGGTWGKVGPEMFTTLGT